MKMENKTISQKQANEIDTGKEGNSEPGTSEPATIEKKTEVTKELERNDLMKNDSKKKFSLNDLNNEDELDFLFKDLDEKELDAL